MQDGIACNQAAQKQRPLHYGLPFPQIGQSDNGNYLENKAVNLKNKDILQDAGNIVVSEKGKH